MENITLKKCGKCNTEKNLSEFNKNKAKNDGHSATCRNCMKSYTRNHYKENKSYYINKNRKWKEKVLSFLKEYKENICCEKCGENHPSTLDFHHLDTDEKEFEISRWRQKASTIKKLKKEIEKCIVLCANCHRKLHWEEKQNLAD
jgi:hypothetical protein